ncbi:hypothetical protein DSBG_2327 [Desulfosporosinus sp. BG]|nr:hypothetical protein DSBG_2327 [Desulfosporosinus sp. BG]
MVYLGHFNLVSATLVATLRNLSYKNGNLYSFGCFAVVFYLDLIGAKLEELEFA